MFHLVLDFEMCNVIGVEKSVYRCGSEIIQIGAVMLDEHYELCDSFNHFVCPRFGAVDDMIEELTGIKDKQLRREPYLPEVLDAFVSWIGDRECRIYTWSDSDLRQLRKEIRAKAITMDSLNGLLDPARWVDYQKVFGKRFDMGRCIALWEAIEVTGLSFDGQAHDGYNDAVNTAHLVAKLELDKDFKLPVIYRNDKFERSSAPLGFGLEGLFEGIDVGMLPAS